MRVSLCRSGRALHPLLHRHGFAFVATAIAARSELAHTASNVQELIQRFCEEGLLDKALAVLSENEISLSDQTYISLLKACNKSKSLPHVKRVQVHVSWFASKPSDLVGEYLVMTLAKCGDPDEALKLFGTLERRTVYSWTALIAALVDYDRVHDAFDTYCCMQKDNVEPDNYTFVALLRACGYLGDLVKGKRLHLEIRRRGFGCNLFIDNTLISMYGRCGGVNEAESVFWGMSQRNIVSWCSLLCAYIDNRQAEKALRLYRQARMEGVRPDSHTYVFTLQACNLLAEEEESVVNEGQLLKMMSFEIGRALHSDARCDGLISDVFVGTALVGMYGKCQAITEAEHVFWALPERNIVSWNAMLTAYMELDQGKKALWLYRQVLTENKVLDEVTFICILQASSETGCAEICRHLHFEVTCARLETMFSVAATLVHAYGCSASMADAQLVFDQLVEPHIAAWNTHVLGNNVIGKPFESLKIFETMRFMGNVKPDDVTFLSVLSACSHHGLFAQAFEYFGSMTEDHNLIPDLRHFGIVINLLGRAGSFRHVEGILIRMPMKPNLTIWLCLLGACRLHGNLSKAMTAFRQAAQLQPACAEIYVLMSNIYGDAGLHKCAAEMQQLQKERCGEELDIDLDERVIGYSF